VNSTQIMGIEVIAYSMLLHWHFSIRTSNKSGTHKKSMDVSETVGNSRKHMEGGGVAARQRSERESVFLHTLTRI